MPNWFSPKPKPADSGAAALSRSPYQKAPVPGFDDNPDGADTQQVRQCNINRHREQSNDDWCRSVHLSKRAMHQETKYLALATRFISFLTLNG